MLSQFTYKPNTFSSQNWPENTPVFHSASSGKEKDTETGYHYFGARYYNSDLSLWLSVDPMSDKYPSLSPYNYCAWNPMKLVDPDGATPRIYVETKGVGHAFVSVVVKGETIVYTYGRYLGGDKNKSSLNTTDPTGKGVLIKLTGSDAKKYITHEVDDMKASAFEFDDASDERVMEFFDGLFSSGTKLSQGDAVKYDANPNKYGSSEDARVVDQYSLFTNNCVTTSTKGIKNGGTNVDFTNEIRLPDASNAIKSDIISPKGLKDYLNQQSKYNPKVNKVKNVDVFSGAN